MPEINANFVVQPFDITIVSDVNNLNVAVEPLNLSVYTSAVPAAGGNNGQLQYNEGGILTGAANTLVANGNVSFTNISNIKIAGGSAGYYLQTDGSGILTWAPGTANVTGGGSAAGANNQIQLSDGAGNFKVGSGFTFDPNSNVLNNPGNISASYYIGDGSTLSNITAANITGIVANANYANTATTAGTVFSNAQPNISSLGILTGLDINGNLIAANITANTGTFTGNGAGLTNLSGGNVTGQVANALIAGTVYTNAQPNITSVGTLSNLIVTGNANTGNLNTGRIVATGNISGTQLISNIATGTPPLVVTSTTTVNNLSANRADFASFVTASGQPNITSVGVLSNLIVQGFIQSNATLTNGIFANAGTVGGNLLRGRLDTFSANQANITSVGTLTSLNVTGNIIAGNISANSTFSAPNMSATTVGTTNLNVFGNTLSNNYTANNYIKITPTTVANLGNATTLGAGTKAFVNDSNVVAFNDIVGGGGGNRVPVFSDGTNWRVG